MQANKLLVGRRYILKRYGSAVYDGIHAGELTLADGSTFSGGSGALRFRGDDGQTRLIDNGSGVEEPEETMIERQRLEQAQEDRENAAQAEALTYLTEHGLTVLPVRAAYRDRTDPDDRTHAADYTSPRLKYAGRLDAKEDWRALEIDNFTVNDLLIALNDPRAKV